MTRRKTLIDKFPIPTDYFASQTKIIIIMKKISFYSLLLAIMIVAIADRSTAQDTASISALRTQYSELLMKFNKLRMNSIICCSSAQCNQRESPGQPPEGSRPARNPGSNDCWGNRPLLGREAKCGTCMVPKLDSPSVEEMGVYRVRDDVITSELLAEQINLLSEIKSLLTRIQSLNISLSEEVSNYSDISIALLSVEKGLNSFLTQAQITSYTNMFGSIENAYNEYSLIKRDTENLLMQSSKLSTQVEDFYLAFGDGLKIVIEEYQ